MTWLLAWTHISFLPIKGMMWQFSIPNQLCLPSPHAGSFSFKSDNSVHKSCNHAGPSIPADFQSTICWFIVGRPCLPIFSWMMCSAAIFSDNGCRKRVLRSAASAKKSDIAATAAGCKNRDWFALNFNSDGGWTAQPEGQTSKDLDPNAVILPSAVGTGTLQQSRITSAR